MAISPKEQKNIKADFQSNSLEGDYLTMFNEFIKPITKHSAVAEYIEKGGRDMNRDSDTGRE